jgi:hypothetical protein
MKVPLICSLLFVAFAISNQAASKSNKLHAEELLLGFSTSDLIAAAQTDNLTEQQLEGAARLFAGWDFSQRRPSDLYTLSPELKKKLLDHSLNTTDEDKLDRAKHAFARP